jgi:hypothetical protein
MHNLVADTPPACDTTAGIAYVHPKAYIYIYIYKEPFLEIRPRELQLETTNEALQL